MFLSSKQIKQLTGATHVELQKEWLGKHGYKFEENRSGQLVVLEAAVNKKLGGPVPRERVVREPDFNPVLAKPKKPTIH